MKNHGMDGFISYVNKTQGFGSVIGSALMKKQLESPHSDCVRYSLDVLKEGNFQSKEFFHDAGRSNIKGDCHSIQMKTKEFESEEGEVVV